MGRPVEVEAPVRTVQVAAVVPCFNRPGDLAALVEDLARCGLGVGETGKEGKTPGLRPGLVEKGLAAARIELTVIVVDNASNPPLELPRLPSHIATRLVRLAANTGGSGGYNAGMAHALTGLDAEPDYLWLVDSDARVEPDTLAGLLNAMEADRSLVVTGPALADTETGAVQEVGGRLDRRTGRFGPHAESLAETSDGPIECDYVAACCALVRAEPVRRVGLFPDVFLNADDVEWCLRLAHEVGGRVAVLPGVRAAHPRFDRFGTLPRYFGARNAFGPIDALGLGRMVRFRRASREIMRAVNQHLMGRADLAALHIRGLRDAAAGRLRGLPADLPRIEGVRPLGELGDALRQARCRTGPGQLAIEWPGDMPAEQRQSVRRLLAEVGFDVDAAARAPSRSIAAFLRRAVAGPARELAVVPAKGSPAHWLLAKTMVEVAGGGFVLRTDSRWTLLARCARSVVAGSWHAARIAGRTEQPSVLPAPADVAALAPTHQGTPAGTPCRLSVIVLSYNRKDALLETLRRLRLDDATRDAEIVVVDNASTDGSVEAVREHAPWATLLALDTNEAIAGFNRGVEAASGECVLILDDDSRPENGSIDAAMALLADRPDLGAVTLVPYHPRSKASEWPFAETLGSPRDDWPVMGCCNLVRRRVWRAVGGYDESFFLYRNDTDLAMKTLAAGLGVHCNPAWRCEHDSPAAAQKSARWCELATRNWLWLARRHGRGWRGVGGALAGWAWAHRLAGRSPARQLGVARGAIAGLVRAPAILRGAVRPDGRAFDSLLNLRFGRRNGAGR